LKLVGYILLIAAAIDTMLSVNFGEYSVVLPLVLIGGSFIEIPENYKLSLLKYFGWAIIFSSAYFVFRLPFSEKFILLIPFMFGYWLAGLRYTNDGKQLNMEMKMVVIEV